METTNNNMLLIMETKPHGSLQRRSSGPDAAYLAYTEAMKKAEHLCRRRKIETVCHRHFCAGERR